jgi:formamidopyrimidine-DNA glycosylase
VPELPEVETVRARLAPALTGHRFDEVEILDSRLVRPYEPADVAAELQGERVAAVERRGKYLIFRFESGRVLLIHLRMTGNLRHGEDLRDEHREDPHRRAVVRLDDGSDVVYRDVRRFGTWLLLEPGELEPYLAAKVGAEPLDVLFTAARLGERLARRRAPV